MGFNVDICWYGAQKLVDLIRNSPPQFGKAILEISSTTNGNIQPYLLLVLLVGSGMVVIPIR